MPDGIHIQQPMRHTDFLRAHLCAHHDRHSPYTSGSNLQADYRQEMFLVKVLSLELRFTE